MHPQDQETTTNEKKIATNLDDEKQWKCIHKQYTLPNAEFSQPRTHSEKSITESYQTDLHRN